MNRCETDEERNAAVLTLGDVFTLLRETDFKSVLHSVLSSSLVWQTEHSFILEFSKFVIVASLCIV